MRTTIVVEDGAPEGRPAARQQFAAASASDAGPAPEGASANRAAPSAGARGAAGIDGGLPPGWLIDAIAAAGGMAAPASPEGIEHIGRDAGAAPGR